MNKRKKWGGLCGPTALALAEYDKTGEVDSYFANSEWLTKMAAGDDNNGCYHGGLQLQRPTAMVTAGACDGGVVLRAFRTREPSLVAIRSHDAHVHEQLNDLQSIYLHDLEIVARAMAAAIGTAKGKADNSGSRHG